MKFLACRPTFYDVLYEINPWMDLSSIVDTKLALEQWKTLISKIRNLGARIKELHSVINLPDMVFTRDAAFIYEEVAYLAAFKKIERRQEEKYFEQWLKDTRYKIRKMPPGHFFEGGDLVQTKKGIVAAYGFRTTKKAIHYLKKNLDLKAVLKLVDPNFYHLDTAFLPVDRETCIFYPKAFDKESIKKIKAMFPNSIAINKTDAGLFAANAIIIDDNIVLSDCSSELEAVLKEFKIHKVDLSEFKKSGAGAHCLLMHL